MSTWDEVLKIYREIQERLEYPLDEEELKRMLQWWPDKDTRLVWMRPEEFLSKVPHPAFPGISAVLDLEHGWSESSIEHITEAIINKKKLPPLFLDYTRMIHGWPEHEGRHRALVSLRLGIKKVPVIIVKEKKLHPMTLEYAKKMSKFTGVPLEEVLKSEPVRRYEEKIRGKI